MNTLGIGIDSTNPVPMPFDIALISFFYVGFLVLSIATIYFFSGFVSATFFTILAKSLTWIAGTLFFPFPT